MRLCAITRLIGAAGTVLIAAPAFAQSANLGLTLTALKEADVSTKGFPIGGTKTFEATITNPDPTLVTSFTVSVPTIDPALKVVAGSVTGCAEITAGTDFPCVVTATPGIQSGTTAVVDFDVEFKLPSTLPTTCPTAATLYGVTVAISDVKQGTVAVTNTGTSSANYATYLRAWTDLEVVSLDGPPSTGEGQNVVYTTVVRNNGPCDATHVRATMSPPATLTYVDGSASATCTNGSSTATGFGARNRCELGTVANGATTNFSATYTVSTFPKSIIKAAIPMDVTAVSRSTGATVAAVDDPNTDNNSASTQATVDLSGNDKGCSTGGAGTIVGLLSLLALRLGRRRSS